MSVKKLDTYAIGVNNQEEPIEAIVFGPYHSNANIHRIALISGLSSESNSQEIYREAIQTLANFSQEISFIGSDFTGINSTLTKHRFPPESGYFSDRDCPESRYIWRWLTMEAPDVVIEVENGPNLLIDSFPNGKQEGSLLSALATDSSKTPGPIPGIRITCTAETVGSEISSIVGEMLNAEPLMSGARSELDKRSSRTALQTARILAKTYGHKLGEPINYVQGVAISGRLRLKELDPTYQDPTDDIVGLVEFLTSDNAFNNNNISGPNMAAMCWANELYETTGNEGWRTLIVKAADCYQQAETGKPPLYMAKSANQGSPDFGCEDMFFISSMCGRAFEITKERKYLDSYVDFLLESNTQQDDGLFWHCRSAPFLWGRGNGFAALAFAEGLTFIPDNHPSRDILIGMHNRHMEGLSNLQQSTGMWTQLLDFPGTYQELSVTCMVGYALARGLRMGWLSEKFLPILNKAWEGVNRRISENADLVDVCTGTGFQEKRSDYLYRDAEYGYDDRGGSMAIWFSTEMESLLRSQTTD